MSHGNEKTYYRRRLPHIVPPGATFFVTFRLAGTLPREAAAQWAMEETRLERELAAISVSDADARRQAAAQQRFRDMDAWLDRADTGPRWLNDERVAQLVANSLAWIDVHKATIHAYCVMPNHVHVLLTPHDREASGGQEGSVPLAEVMHSIKGYTAQRANALLGRSGTFWQDESYDRYVRSNREFEQTARYLLDNPVKAGLVFEAEAWPWSYCRDEQL